MLVSVNILTKNRLDFLRNALQSVFAQTGVVFEVVVINDGSSDGTVEYLNDLKLEKNNLKVIHHEASVGIIKSRQEALANSSGELIAFLDDDDEWIRPTKLAEQVTKFTADSSLVICGGGMELVNDSGEVVGIRIVSGDDAEIRKAMLLKNQFFTSTVLVRKTSLEKAGGFLSDGIDLAEDYDLWLRIGVLGKMALLSEVVTRYRIPSYSREKKLNFFKKQWKLIKREKGNYPNGFLAEIYMILRVFRTYVVFWS